MGRTSKFTFPVPGRRQKQQNTMGPIVSNPMSKAQRILGAAELNIDAPKQWDEASTSGISISVSDHTTAYTATERGGYPRPEEQAQNGYNGSRVLRDANRWEMDSETVPAHVQGGRGVHGEDTARDYMSDASSLRRRQSNSTLKSWYDKSKMPLSISQQTSSSAMAKGVPAKASALLDVDGTDTASNASQAKAARRPSRLNLAQLFHGNRNRDSHIQPSPSSGSMLNQEFSRSPSTASPYSPGTHASSPVLPRTPRKLLRKPTKERLAEEAAANAGTTTASSRPRSSSNQSEGSGLNLPRDLYDHYERTAFRDIMESPAEEEADPLDDDAAAARLIISDFPAAPVGPTPLRSPSYPRRSTTSSNPIINEPHHESKESHWPSEGSTKAGYPRNNGNYAASDIDYASSLASVSSRHTKTSKASKRTNPSISESDRQERSVLSLSSDSEEDDETSADTASKSAASVSSYSHSLKDAPPSPVSVSRKSMGSRGESMSDTASRKSGKRASFALTHTYLTVPAGAPPNTLKPTTFNPRTSSINKGAAQSTQSSPPASSLRSSARMSTLSTSTSASAEWQSQAKQSYGVHEATAVTVHSVASTASSIQDVTDAQERPAIEAPSRQSLRSGDQPTPPLSPSSVEFCLQPDMSFDVAGNPSNNPRFMAVTRQEQMLLAALRNKRAMMREHIIAEVEAEQTPVPPRGLAHKHTSSQATIRGPQTEDQRLPQQDLRHQVSSTSNSTITSASHATEKRGPPSTKSRSSGRSRAESRTDATSRDGQDYHSGRQHARRAHGYTTEMSPEPTDADHDGPSETDDERTREGYTYHNRPSAAHRQRQNPGPLSSASSSNDARSRSTSRKANSSTRRRPAHEANPAPRVPEEEHSPKSSTRTLAPPAHDAMSRKKLVRLSAVGRAGPEVGWWGDDG